MTKNETLPVLNGSNSSKHEKSPIFKVHHAVPPTTIVPVTVCETVVDLDSIKYNNFRHQNSSINRILKPYETILEYNNSDGKDTSEILELPKSTNIHERDKNFDVDYDDDRASIKNTKNESETNSMNLTSRSRLLHARYLLLQSNDFYFSLISRIY